VIELQQHIQSLGMKVKLELAASCQGGANRVRSVQSFFYCRYYSWFLNLVKDPDYKNAQYQINSGRSIIALLLRAR